MKICLIFPPYFPPTQPYLSVPCLTAYLKHHGFEVVQRDLNVEFFDDLLNRNRFYEVFQNLRAKFHYLHVKDPLSEEDFASYWSLRLANIPEEGVSWLAGVADQLKSFFRDPSAFFNVERYVEQKNILYQIQEYVLHDQHSLLTHRMGLRTFTEKEILSEIERCDSPLCHFIEPQCKSIAEENPNLVGVSIIAEDQIIPGLMIASLLKKTLKDVHITIGGSIVSLWGESLTQCKDLFKIIDSAILFEGEKPLLKLAESLKACTPLQFIPNLIFREQDHVVMNRIDEPEDVNSLPAPHFKGLPLERYFSPHLVLPVLASRGCYWGRCTFCNHHHTYRKVYRLCDVEQTVRVLERLSSNYNAEYFTFSDEALSPQQCRELSRHITEKGLNVKWLGDIRADPGFCREDFELMVRAGCKALYIGLESACSRVLNKMRKGISTTELSRICKSSSEVGIWNHLYVIVGFPTETKDEFQETIEYIFSNIGYIDSVGINTCSVGRHSHIYRYPEQYRIRIVKPSASDHDLTIWYDFITSEGMNNNTINTSYKSFVQQVNERFPSVETWGRMPRTELFLYLCRYGRNKFRRMRLSDRRNPDRQVASVYQNIPYFSIGEGIYPITLNVPLRQGVGSGAGLIRGPRHYLIDVTKGITYPISDFEQFLLLLCQHCSSMEDVVDTFVTAFPEMKENELRKAFVRTLNTFLQKGVIEPQIS